MSLLLRVLQAKPREADLSRTYDAVVIGSGAAGGMAAHVLTSRGLDVLLLEAGKQLDLNAELKSMEWPYDHPRRGDDAARPHGAHPQRVHDPQAALRARATPTSTSTPTSRAGAAPTTARTSSSTRRITPTPARTTPGCARGASAARRTSGDGWRCACRIYDFKAKSHDGYGEDWPISYADIEPYYDKVDLLPRHLGREGEPAAPARQPVPAAVQAERGGGPAARVAGEDGPRADALPRRRHDRRPEAQQVSQSKCFGRGACGRRAGGCDIHAAFDSPTGLIAPAMETGHLTIRTNATVREVTVESGHRQGARRRASSTPRPARATRRRARW